MIHRPLNAQRRPLLLPFLVGLLVAGCSNERAPRSETSVGSTYDALAAKLKDCERSKRECKDASACEPAALALCEDSFASCREAADAEKDALRAATDACRIAEDTCKQNASDSAADKACHEQHHTCMRATQPAAPPCHAALDACLDDARATAPTAPVSESDDADDAGVEPGPGPGHKPPKAKDAMGPKPPAPPPDAKPPAPPVGTKPPAPAPPAPPKPRPESAAERACHEQARACMTAEMEADPGTGAHVHCPPAVAPGGPKPPLAGAPAIPPPPPLPAAGAAGSQ
ncbi:MAG: hypothetical protein RL701_7669 [Pseudomonadota bacterium]